MSRIFVAVFAIFTAGLFFSGVPAQAEIPCVHSEVSNAVSFVIDGRWEVRKIHFGEAEAFVDMRDTGYLMEIKKQREEGWVVKLYNVNVGVPVDVGYLYACLPCPETAYYIRWPNRYNVGVFAICTLTEEQLRAYYKQKMYERERKFPTPPDEGVEGEPGQSR